MALENFPGFLSTLVFVLALLHFHRHLALILFLLVSYFLVPLDINSHYLLSLGLSLFLLLSLSCDMWFETGWVISKPPGFRRRFKDAEHLDTSLLTSPVSFHYHMIDSEIMRC